jgi:MFS transporter, OFA family, oxalate/formate antiporter
MPLARRWFPGYTIAGMATLAYLVTAPGQTFVISQLNLPIREAFGITELTLNTAYAVATIAAALPLVLVGSLVDRLGPRRMLPLVALAYGLGCMAMAAAAGPLTVFLGFFLLRFLGQGSLSLVSQHLLAMWFHRRLGSMQGVMQVVVFGVWIMAPQMALLLINTVGWRTTYVIFGLVIWIAIIPLSLWLVRNRPEDLGLHMDNNSPASAHAVGVPRHSGPSELPQDSVPSEPSRDPVPNPGIASPPEPAFLLREATRTRAYWTLAAAFLLPPLIGTAFLFEMQPMLVGRGMNMQHAAIAVSAWAATMCVMALPSGYVTDRLQPSLLVSGGMSLIALSAIFLMLAHAPAAAAAAMIVFGVGQSLVAVCAGATLARYFGRRHHGAIRSSTMRIAVIGTGLGPIVTGASVRLMGSYSAAMIAFVLLCATVAVLGVALRAPVAASAGQTSAPG